MKLKLDDTSLCERTAALKILAEACDQSYDAKLMGTQDGPKIVMIDGPSGTGKSILVQHAMKLEEKKRPEEFVPGENKTYFCSGKFNQIEGVEPYSALKQAFAELVDSLFNTSSKQELCLDLREALGAEVKILNNVVPGIAALVDTSGTEDISDTQGSVEAFLRLKFLVKSFVRTICKRHRLVLFLDDLQWSDKSTIELIETIISDCETHQFLFLGSYRTDEVDKEHALTRMMEQVEKYRPIQHIHLENMTINGVNEMIQKLTGCEPEDAKQLSELVHRKTLGNPLMVREFLQLLEEEKLIQYSLLNFQWTFDIEKISKNTNLPDSVVGVVLLRIQRLPARVQDCLKIAACLWCEFHVASLLLILNNLGDEFATFQTKSDLTKALNIATEESLLDKLDNGYYRFSHDKVQESSYSMVAEPKKLHWKIGKVIWEMRREGLQEDWLLFSAADQLNQGMEVFADQTGVESCHSDKQIKQDIAQLNLEAALKAVDVSAFIPASRYLSQGINILDDNCWEEKYEMALQLHVKAAEIYMCIGDHSLCVQYANIALAKARTLAPKISVYMSLINAYGNQAQFDKAMTLSVGILKDLGEGFPKKANMFQVLRQLSKTKRALKKFTDNDILSLPRMSNEQKVAAMKILNKYSLHAILQQRTADMLLCLIRNVQLTLKYGLSNLSPSAFCAYGLVLATLGKTEEGIRYGELAMKLLAQLNAKEWVANCTQIFYMALGHFKIPYSECIPPLTRAFKVGMAYGDIEFAFYTGLLSVSYYFLSGLNLDPCESDCRLYCKQILVYNRKNNYNISCPIWQLVLNLQGLAADPLMLVGEAMDETTMIDTLKQEKNVGALQSYWIHKSMLCYYFDDMEAALKVLNEFGKTKDSIASHYFTTMYAYFLGLVSIALARKTKRRKHGKTAQKSIDTVKSWVNIGNMNMAHRLLILIADYNGLRDKNERTVREKFDAAIVAASRGGYIQDAALANERAGSWFASGSTENDRYWSTVYIHRAYSLYASWGAHGKARHMVYRYPSILSPDASASLETTAGQSANQFTTQYDGSAGSTKQSATSSSADGRSWRSSSNFRSVKQFDADAFRQHCTAFDRSGDFCTGSSSGCV